MDFRPVSGPNHSIGSGCWTRHLRDRLITDPLFLEISAKAAVVDLCSRSATEGIHRRPTNVVSRERLR